MNNDTYTLEPSLVTWAWAGPHKLQWLGIGRAAYRFTGSPTGDHELTNASYDRALAHWCGYVENAQRAVAEAGVTE